MAKQSLAEKERCFKASMPACLPQGSPQVADSRSIWRCRLRGAMSDPSVRPLLEAITEKIDPVALSSYRCFRVWRASTGTARTGLAHASEATFEWRAWNRDPH